MMGGTYHVFHTELKRHWVVHHQLNFTHISLNPLEVYKTHTEDFQGKFWYHCYSQFVPLSIYLSSTMHKTAPNGL